MDPRGRHNCGPHQFHGKTPIQIVQKFKDRQPVNLAVHVVLWLVPGSSNIPLVRDWVHDNQCFLVTNDHMIYIDLLWQFMIRLTVSLFSCLDSCLTLPCLIGKVQSAGAPAAAPLWGCSRTNGLVFGRNSKARNLGKATEPMRSSQKYYLLRPLPFSFNILQLGLNISKHCCSYMYWSVCSIGAVAAGTSLWILWRNAGQHQNLKPPALRCLWRLFEDGIREYEIHLDTPNAGSEASYRADDSSCCGCARQDPRRMIGKAVPCGLKWFKIERV